MSCDCPRPCPPPRIVDTRVDPDPCNAVSMGPDGLLAPRTQVTGFVGAAPGRMNANFPSVDTYITAPPANACPQNWQVKAFHTPPRGAIVLPAQVNLAGTRPGGTWANTGLALRLPQPGAYLIVGAIRTNCCCNIPTNAQPVRTSNIWTRGRLVNAGTGGNLMNGVGLAQHQYSIGAGDEGFQSCHSGTITFTGYVNATAAMTVRVQAGLSGSVSGGTVVQSSIVAEGRLTFVKIAD